MAAPYTICRRFAVPFEYPVLFSEGIFEPESSVLSELLGRSRGTTTPCLFCIVDSGLARESPMLVAEIERKLSTLPIKNVARPLVIPGGEDAKNDPRLIDGLVEAFHQYRLDRHSYVMAVGGGAVLDAVGYATAITHRGLRLLRVPTTVLAQNDSGIGVKNGINAFGSKNFLGTFAPPFAVVNDARLLRTLPRRTARSGYAEAVKVALIRDASFFGWLEQHALELAEGRETAENELIRRCAELHLSHIWGGGDPFEQGSQRPLDFGHWAAHRLEILTDHDLYHGEAVAIGMALDSRYSVEEGLLPEAHFLRVLHLLQRLGLPTFHSMLERVDAKGRLAVLQGLDDFREHLGGELCVTLLTAPGSPVDVREMKEHSIVASIAWLRGASDAA